MPIELWWWAEPLFLTGWATVFVFGLLAWLAYKVRPYSNISGLLAVLAIVPWILWALSGVLWIVINVLVLIWG